MASISIELMFWAVETVEYIPAPLTPFTHPVPTNACIHSTKKHANKKVEAEVHEGGVSVFLF